MGRGNCPFRAEVLRTLGAGLLGLLLGALLLPAGIWAKECADCHAAKEAKKPPILLPPGSAHAELECAECHAGLKVQEDQPEKPHGEKVRPVQCKQCHEDQAKAFAGSSHSLKLKEFFEKAGKTKPALLCLACHGEDAHTLVKAKDPASPMARAHTAQTCLKCHQTRQPIVIGTYLDSVHSVAVSQGKKAAICTDCHGGHGIDHSNLPKSSVNRKTIPETCGKCHPKELEDYRSSYHWTRANKGFVESPVCTGCHGEHNIRSSGDVKSATFAGNVTKTCSGCHASERMTAKFLSAPGKRADFEIESFHGVSSTKGDVRVANCSSCHGHHSILPRDDPRSTVNPANLGKTCGACHPGAETRFIAERIHTNGKQPSHWIVALVRQVYYWLIGLTIGGMILHNLLDLRYKAMRGMPYHKHELFDLRLTVNERIQHAFLATSFIALAVSGLARQYPESPFSWPFRLFPEELDSRGLIHRLSAVVFLVLSAYHFLYLLVWRRGRMQFLAMLPRPRDLWDIKDVLLKYLGLSQKPLTLEHYSYVEKAEYWALVWGSVVMTVTGLMLWFVNVSIASLPLWGVDLARTIHFLEAVLAVLAILVWHGYWVALDPEYYPLNLTWLLGRPRPLKPASQDPSQKTASHAQSGHAGPGPAAAPGPDRK